MLIEAYYSKVYNLTSHHKAKNAIPQTIQPSDLQFLNLISTLLLVSFFSPSPNPFFFIHLSFALELWAERATQLSQTPTAPIYINTNERMTTLPK